MIGTNYHSLLPRHPIAPAAIADHIRKYWDPRMRRQIFEHLAAHGGEGLKPAALAAIQTLAASDPAAKTAAAS